MRGRVGVKMPTKDAMKDGVMQAQRRFPLKRSRTDRIFLGVCGGIGKALGIDANLVRLVWAAFSISSIGMGVLIYVALGLLLPEEVDVEMELYTPERDVQIIDVTAASGGKS
jgi:phage shock protein PspC (stress-responsive transcriptional regulator)